MSASERTLGSPKVISVLGTGYLGTLQSACLAELGHQVIGFDVNAERVAILNSGIAPIHEPGLDEMLAKHVASGQLRFTTNIEDVKDADIHVICVGTPQKPDSDAADLTQLWSVADLLAEHIKPGALVMGRSTVPVGTARELAARLSKKLNQDVMLTWNPEFLREGFGVQDTLRPDRLVFGVEGESAAKAEAILRELYFQAIDAGVPVVVADWQTAELVKTSANAFLATKISFINAIAEICEVTGADVTKVADAIGLDDRIGRKFLGAGLGFGGGCLPKDIRAFRARAIELGVGEALDFLEDIDQINLRRRERTVELTRQAVGGELKGKKVTVLGAAFKPNSDDVRDSPALDVASKLHDSGAQVTVHDPKAIENGRKAATALAFEEDLAASIEHAEALVLATEWSNYRELDPSTLQTRAKAIVDARNSLDSIKWTAAGFKFYGLGKPAN